MAAGEPNHAGGTYRGLLFADLRGYTADVERYGDRAASTLIDTYRVLVRRAVADHAGAEIKTEGDSFYVVFPSAQQALRCAVAIGEAAAEHSRATEGIPLRVGLGVHAGEVIKGSEGYVGSAVNIAARICAAARSGEVLASSTVRDLTRTGLMFAFQSRGIRRLKGIGEPIELFAVSEHALPRTALQGAIDRLASPRAHGIGLALAVGVLAFGAAILYGDHLLGRGDPALETAQGLEPAGSVSPGGSHAGQAPSAAPTSSAAPTLGAFPNETETALLSRLDPDLANYCRRADPADAPRVTQLRGTHEVFPLPVVAGFRCELVLADQPDVVYVWHALEHIRTVDDAFFRFTGAAGLRSGDCAVEDRTYGGWEFGEWAGNVACFVSEDDARIIWTYHGTRIMGIAIRNDSDSRALYRWWREDARLLGTAD